MVIHRIRHENKEANAERFLQGNSFPAYRPAWKDKRLLQAQYFEQSMGDLLVDLADEIPPVVVDLGGLRQSS